MIQLSMCSWLNTYILAQRSVYSHNNLTTCEKLFVAGSSGCISSLYATPIETVMIQQQRYQYNLIDTFWKIGISNMTRGLLPTAIRETVWTTGYLALPAIFLEELRIRNYISECNKNTHIFTCMVSAFCVSAVSHPFDTVKTCMQGDLTSQKYGNTKETFISCIEEGGYRRLFRGFGWRYSRHFCGVFMFNNILDDAALYIYPRT